MDVQTGIEKGKEVVTEFKRMRLIGEHHALGPCTQMAEIIASELVAAVVDEVNEVDLAVAEAVSDVRADMRYELAELEHALECLKVVTRSFEKNIHNVGPAKAAELFLEAESVRALIGKELEKAE